MAVIGLIGGIAPESSVAYYRALIAGHRESGDTSYPHVIINSIDMSRMLALLGKEDKSEAVAFLAAEANRLKAAGADFGGFASNTPHLVFPAVQAKCTLPLVSIVDATAAVVKQQAYRRVGLLGTRLTMEGGFYQEMLKAAGIAVITPSADDRTYVHEIYYGELVKAIFRPETRQALIAVIARMQLEDQIEAVILGGTELPLILTPDSGAPLPLLDTGLLHVRALLARGRTISA